MRYKKDLVEPWRGGEPSREFIDSHADITKTMFAEMEIEPAKRVWSDTPGLRISKTKYTN